MAEAFEVGSWNDWKSEGGMKEFGSREKKEVGKVGR
jgi:hypothetical protein